MRRLRRLFLATIALGLVLGIALTLLRNYLNSPAGAARIAARLEAIYGGRVEVAGIDVGLRGVSLRDVQLFEAGPNAPDAPWLVIPQARVDLSLWDLLRGEVPSELTLTGPTIVLRFDRNGHLATRFPEAATTNTRIDTIRVVGGRVILRQDGRPDTTITDVNADLRAEGERYILSGTGVEAGWGRCEVGGFLVLATGELALTVKSPKVHFTQAMLGDLPFVDPTVWKEVQAEGDATAAELSIHYFPDRGRVHYRLAVEPQSIRVEIRAIDLTATHVSGQVVVEDGLFQMRDVRGETAEGSLHAGGDLDFRHSPGQMSFVINVDRLKLKRLPASWSLPRLLDGRLSGHANLRIRLAEVGARASGVGEGVIRDAHILGLPAEPIRLKLLARGNGFSFKVADTLAQPQSRAPPAERPLPVRALPLSRRATAAVDDPPAVVEADVAVNHGELSQLLRGLGMAPPQVLRGRLSLRAHVTIPLETPHTLRTYRGRGTVRLDGLRFGYGDWSASDLEAKLRLRNSVLSLGNWHGEVDGVAVTGTGRLSLATPYRWEVTAEGNADDPAVRLLTQKFDPSHRVEGTVVTNAAVHGTLRPFHLEAIGSLVAPELRVDSWPFDQVSLHWRADAERVRVTDLHASLFGGALSGDAVLPVQESLPGRLTVLFRDLRVSQLAREGLALPVNLKGRIAGTVLASLSAAEPGKPRGLSAQAELSSPRVWVETIPVERLRGIVGYGAQGTNYNFAADLLGGLLQFQGPQPEGRLHIEAAALSRLWEALGAQDVLGSLHGRVDFDLGFQQRPEQPMTGDGRFALRELRWGETALADALWGDVSVNGPQIDVKNLEGGVGQGLLRGHVRYNLRQPGRSSFRVTLDQIEASRLLAPWPAIGAHVEGPLEIQMRGSLGRQWQGVGSVLLSRGSVYGVEVVNARLPLDFVFVPEDGRGRVEVREASAQVAMGQVNGRGTLGWGWGSRLEGQVRFNGVELRPVLQAFGENSSLGSGRVSGQVDLGGENVKSLDGLTGRLQASLQQTQALQFPVLRQVAPYLTRGGSASSTFQAGDLEARLSRGVVRIQRLRLVGSVMQVLIEGTVTLQGALNLEVTANTGGLAVNAPSPRLLGMQVPAVSAIPVAIVIEATNLLANRLVHLRVSGNVRSPVIQPSPLLMLTEEAVRFFLALASGGVNVLGYRP